MAVLYAEDEISSTNFLSDFPSSSALDNLSTRLDAFCMFAGSENSTLLNTFCPFSKKIPLLSRNFWILDLNTFGLISVFAYI